MCVFFIFITLATDNTTESCDKAVRTLVQCTDIIVESNIDPSVLARKLYTKEVISENVYMRVRDRASRDTNEESLETISVDLKSRVKYNVSIMMTFVDILRNDFKQNDLANIIMSKFK